MLTELAGPTLFGLGAFAMIFAATELLNIGRMVTNDHAPLWAAIAVFLWQLPAEVVFVIPMALLLGTLLAMQRLSAESEFTAHEGGRDQFLSHRRAAFGGRHRDVVRHLRAAREASSRSPACRSAEIEDEVINHVSAFGRDLTVSAPLPGGGRQVTIATAFDPNSSALLHVTLIQYDRNHQPTQIVFADRAEFAADKWTLENSSGYRFNPDGTTLSERVASQEVEIGENPTDIVKRIKNDDPNSMSRSQIAAIVRSGQLTETEMRKYVTTYQEKLAQPFACFVFMLIAIPFGLRPPRGGSGVGIGFGLSIVIIFVYYVVMVICSYVGGAWLPLAWLWAWMPNIIFTAIGIRRLRRAALV